MHCIRNGALLALGAGGFSTITPGLIIGEFPQCKKASLLF